MVLTGQTNGIHQAINELLHVNLLPPTLPVTARTLQILSSTSPSTGSTLATETVFLKVAIKFTFRGSFLKKPEQLILYVMFTLCKKQNAFYPRTWNCVATKSAEPLLCQDKSCKNTKGLAIVVCCGFGCALKFDSRWGKAPRARNWCLEVKKKMISLI